MANISAIQLPDGNTYNIKDDTSGYITGMTILSYGNSTWQDFLDAYNAHKVVYCRASSNSNPASGSQTRLAFLAYVNNATNPTSVEFQYYRSVSSHSDSQQGDQVYVYKLTSAGAWSVTVREAYSKIAVGGDLTKSYASGTITLSADIPEISLNGSSTTSASFYAPTTAGTSGQVLTSDGSGAPTWAAAPSGGGDIFVAEYNPQTETGTPFNDIKAAYEAGKHVILDVSAQDSIHTFLPLILIIDMLTSETPYATAGFSIVQNDNDSGALVSIVCTVHPDPEDSSQFIEEWEHFDFDVQSELLSGTNIKTINNQSLLGSGNLTIDTGGHTELTQAQYDALSQAEKENGDVYFITDGSPIPSSLINLFYPIGSYYETSDTSFDPNLSWGGTWSLETEGQVHISAGTNYTVAGALTNATDGGEETHTLTIAEMPAHSHTFGLSANQNVPQGSYYGVKVRDTTSNTSTVGGGQAHNNMQPYIVVNRWHRTA